jgi:protease II
MEESNETCFLEISRTKDWRYLLISSGSKTSSEVRVVDAYEYVPERTCWPSLAMARAFATDMQDGSPYSGCNVVRQRQEGVSYFIDHVHGTFYLITNADGAYNHKLLCLESGDYTTPFAQWRQLVPHSPSVVIEDVELFSVCSTNEQQTAARESVYLVAAQGCTDYCLLSQA